MDNEQSQRELLKSIDDYIAKINDEIYVTYDSGIPVGKKKKIIKSKISRIKEMYDKKVSVGWPQHRTINFAMRELKTLYSSIGNSDNVVRKKHKTTKVLKKDLKVIKKILKGNEKSLLELLSDEKPHPVGELKHLAISDNALSQLKRRLNIKLVSYNLIISLVNKGAFSSTMCYQISHRD